MRFDPYSEAPLSEAYEEISLREVFVENDALLRVAVLVADPASPLSKERDFDIRFREAFKLLGTKKRYQDEITSNSGVWLKVLYEFFRIANDIDYEIWWSLKSSLHHMADKLRSNSGMKDGDRLRISKELKEIGAQVKEIEYGLFKEEYLKDAITKEAVRNSLAGFAEQYALPPP